MSLKYIGNFGNYNFLHHVEKPHESHKKCKSIFRQAGKLFCRNKCEKKFWPI